MNAILAFIDGKPAKTSAIIALEVLFQMARSAIFAAQPGIPFPEEPGGLPDAST